MLRAFAEKHKYLVFNTSGGVCCKLDVLFGRKGVHSLYKPDGSDGNEVLLVGSLGVVLFIRMKQKDTIFP